MLSVLIPPTQAALTTLPAVRAELRLTTEAHDQRLSELIADATAAIETHLDRPKGCGRQKLRETLPGYGDQILQLAQPPIAQVTLVTYRGEVVLDYVVEDAAAGHLYREAGWDSTAGVGGLLVDQPIAGSERPDWAVEYVAGWLLPGDDYPAATLTLSATDNSITDDAGALPFVVPGEFIQLASATSLSPMPPGPLQVVSRTPAKIVVTGATLPNESAGPVITLRCRSLPRDIERAAVLAVSAWHQAAGRDPDIASKRVADTTLTYRDHAAAAGGGAGALPPKALELLAPWRREAW